jgi:release factor glutamine methyltransferase
MTATIGTVLEAAVRRLYAAGIDTARLDARLLLGDVLNLETADLVAHPERPLATPDGERFRDLIERRCRHQPVSQLLARREFWGLAFRVTADTLIPRPETEVVVEQALAGIADRGQPIRILDLGTGTGCLLLTLLHELPRATGLAIDRSPGALAVARANAEALGLAGRAEFRLGNWAEGLSESFDLVVSNPPYISTPDMDRLVPEVARHEPHLALHGGWDGLDCYRAIAGGLAGILRPDGRLLLEIGADQGDSVPAVFAAAGFRCAARHNDLAGLPRCLVLQWNP